MPWRWRHERGRTTRRQREAPTFQHHGKPPMIDGRGERTRGESSMEQLAGGQAPPLQLEREGVRVVFGLPGGQTMYALDALYDIPDIRFITTRHEQATTYMADGYA